MKILVVSDTHGDIGKLIEYVSKLEGIDYLFFLGDYVDDGIKLREILNIPATIVRGNGDYGRLEFNEDETIEIQGKRIFLTHGHNYNLMSGLHSLYYKALEVKADLVLYGHTHLPKIIKKDGITIMNPGSPSYPRTVDKRPSFGLISLTNNQKEEIIYL